MNKNILKAGVGKACIEIPAKFFPMEHFVGIHDKQHVRALILECGIRIVLVSVEMTSIMEDAIEILKETISEKTDTQKENIWICVTHTFATPHLLGGLMLKNADEEDVKKGAMYKNAFLLAVEQAVDRANARMQEAELTVGKGTSDINVNRDIPSDEGWWIGLNKERPSDKTVTLLQVKDTAGKPLAVLYHYGVQSSVMDNVFDEQGGRLITTDLAGKASDHIETILGNDTVAICLLGACGDQVPRERAKYWETGLDGKLKEVDLGSDKGYEIINRLGGQLGNDILEIINGENETLESFAVGISNIVINCPKQKKLFEGFPVPTTTFESIPDGEIETAVSFLKIGNDTMLIGVKGELNYVTAKSLKESSPYRNTLLVQMVNGAQKYMADQDSYEKMTYEAMNSFFGKGAAEKLCEEVKSYLTPKC